MGTSGRHKLSQFADDTTLLLGRVSEIAPALRAVAFWGEATGMRENTKKREGLALGKFRGRNLGRGIKWVEEGKWAKSLGAPIGNDLDAVKW